MNFKTLAKLLIPFIKMGGTKRRMSFEVGLRGLYITGWITCREIYTVNVSFYATDPFSGYRIGGELSGGVRIWKPQGGLK